MEQREGNVRIPAERESIFCMRNLKLFATGSAAPPVCDAKRSVLTACTAMTGNGVFCWRTTASASTATAAWRFPLRGNRLMLRGIGLTEKELAVPSVKHAGESC